MNPDAITLLLAASAVAGLAGFASFDSDAALEQMEGPQRPEGVPFEPSTYYTFRRDGWLRRREVIIETHLSWDWAVESCRRLNGKRGRGLRYDFTFHRPSWWPDER